MSIGPLGVVASVAGSPLAQIKGAEAERAAHASSQRERRVSSLEKAEQAAGVGVTDGEEHQAQDRDGDGRRLWEPALSLPPKSAAADAPDALGSKGSSRDSADGIGAQLDLSG